MTVYKTNIHFLLELHAAPGSSQDRARHPQCTHEAWDRAGADTRPPFQLGVGVRAGDQIFKE